MCWVSEDNVVHREELPVVWDALKLTPRHCNEMKIYEYKYTRLSLQPFEG